ncbi:YlbF family regulator [Sporosarcina ureilytica]|uniref:Regulator n=1 Tax=Sporosarcina ureilytica TaxID=298596 RepID=A0A1D8JI25_9BACL|nr:YlbF family regulator [Sporosarcina ureilytica]AOV08370.1 regulator [Sporosarcina ureilytica]
MLITDEWLTIIEHAEELIKIMASSEVVEEYNKAREAVYSNDVLVKSIKEFTRLKERYEEVQRFGRYHPDYQTVMKDIRLRKRELDLNEQVAALRLAENDVQQLFDEIGMIIGKTVSESVKVPTGNGFFTGSSCGGGCGTGGGCSCSA